MYATSEAVGERRFYRNRYKRTSRTHRINLGECHVEILRLHQRYRYLRSDHIYPLLPLHIRREYRDNTRFKERLGDLFHGYKVPGEPHVFWLSRPGQQKFAYNARYAPIVTELDYQGERVLRELGLQDENMSDLVRRGRTGATRQFPHALMICDTIASIEIGVRKTPGLRFISWVEILEHAPERARCAKNPFAIPASVSYAFPRTGKAHRADVRIIPDGLFGIEYPSHGGKRLCRYFALEAERTNDIWASNFEQTSWLKKVLAYRDIIQNRTHLQQLGIDNLRVLVVAPTRKKMLKVEALLHEVNEGRGSTRFLFQHIPVLGFEEEAAIPLSELFTTPFRRVGFTPFWLDRWEQDE